MSPPATQTRFEPGTVLFLLNTTFIGLLNNYLELGYCMEQERRPQTAATTHPHLRVTFTTPWQTIA